MSAYTTRVQLKGSPSESDYVRLHSAMEASGFTRFIVSDDGETFSLPHAEYNSSGSSRAETLRLAKEAAATISSGAQILVTESSGRTWSNLEKIT